MTPTGKPVELSFTVDGDSLFIHPIDMGGIDELDCALQASIIRTAAVAAEMLESRQARQEVLDAAVAKASEASVTSPRYAEWIRTYGGMRAMLGIFLRRENGERLTADQIREVIANRAWVDIAMAAWNLVNGKNPTNPPKKTGEKKTAAKPTPQRMEAPQSEG